MNSWSGRWADRSCGECLLTFSLMLDLYLVFKGKTQCDKASHDASARSSDLYPQRNRSSATPNQPNSYYGAVMTSLVLCSRDGSSEDAAHWTTAPSRRRDSQLSRRRDSQLSRRHALASPVLSGVQPRSAPRHKEHLV